MHNHFYDFVYHKGVIMRNQVLFLMLVTFFLALPALAQDGPPPMPDLTGEIIMEGLNGPQGVYVAADGSVYVIDSGMGGDEATQFFNPETLEVEESPFGETARILRLTPEGETEEIAVLPSVLVGDGAEGSGFWLNVITELKNRGVQDVFIAGVDGLSGFEDALRAVFPLTEVQRCLVHQVRYSLKYVTQKDRQAFTADLKAIYTSPTREAAETALLQLSERGSDKYALAVRSWETNWEALATMFAYTPEIRRLIYTTNPIEGYNRQLRKATKTKGAFPTAEAVRQSFWLAHQNIAQKWDRPIYNWELILNQLAIRFEERMPL
jgi:hypothetical protein